MTTRQGLNAVRVASNPHLAKLVELIEQFASYVALPDYDGLVFCAGIAATGKMPVGTDPSWGLVVSSSSSAKTEMLRVFETVADDALDDVSMAGLLGWSPQRGKRPGRLTGMLSRHQGESFLALIADMSTVTASGNDRDRDKLYSMLRRAADGAVHRDLGGLDEQLAWAGRLTLLGAATHEIDRVTSHTDALGPRWLYYRLADADREMRRNASATSRRNQKEIKALRECTQALAVEVVREARRRLASVAVSHELGEAIDDAVEVATHGRGHVPRSSYANLRIEGAADVEGPGRMAGQLQRLALGLLALGLAEHDVAAVCRECALSCIPRVRRAVLADLIDAGIGTTPAALAKRIDVHRTPTITALEELWALGLARFQGDDEEAQYEHGVRRLWRIDECWEPRIREVFAAPLKCHDIDIPIPHPPSNRRGPSTNRGTSSEVGR